MRIGLISAAACMMFLATPGWSDDKPAEKTANIAVLGLDLVRPPAPEILKAAVQKADTVGFFMRGGMKFKLLLTVPDRVIVDLDPKRVEVDSFSDDVSGELSATAEASLRNRDASLDSALSTDGHYAMIELALKSLPTKGAKSVSVKGKVKVIAGSGEKTTELQSLPLKPGAPIAAAADLKLTLKSARALGTRPATLLIFEVDGLRGRIKSADFFDEVGNELEAKMSVDRDYGDRERMKTLNFVLTGPAPAAVKVKVSYYEKVEELVVPIKIDTGLGI